jgi:hypothetical protein
VAERFRVFRHVGFFCSWRQETFGIQVRKVSMSLLGGSDAMLLATTAVAHWNGIKVVPESCHELNQKDRIIEALCSVSHIPRVSEDSLSMYYEYLTEHLRFPFLAHFPKPMNSEEDDEFRCTVLKLLGPAINLGDEVDGLYCKTRKGIYELNLPLIDLYLPDDSFRFQLIDDYWFWFWNWR